MRESTWPGIPYSQGPGGGQICFLLGDNNSQHTLALERCLTIQKGKKCNLLLNLPLTPIFFKHEFYTWTALFAFLNS